MIVRSYFAKKVKRDPIRYSSLYANMISIRMGLTLEEYLGRALKISVISGLAFAFFGYVMTDLLITGKIFVNPSLRISLLNNLSPDLLSLLLKIVGVLIAFSLGSLIIYLLFLKYPGMTKGSRATKVNLTIHNAVAYMYAMRRGGAELLTIFRSISANSSIYGEVALEFRQVVRDTDYFGLDIITALKSLSESTPSEKLKEFLEDMISVIESGGDLTAFLAGRVRLYQEEARFEQKEFLNFLSILAESFVTLFVAGPLFLIIIMVVMGMIGGSTSVLQLSLMTYAVFPIGTLGFVILIDMVSLKSEGIEKYTSEKKLEEYSDVKITPRKGEEPLFRKLLRYDQLQNVTNFIRHPVQAFIIHYQRTLFITVPIAIVYLAYIFYANFPLLPVNLETFVDRIDDPVIIAILIVIVPYGIFYEFWQRKVRGVESLVPDFLDRMAGINRVGLTMAQAISVLVNTNLGLLSYEIKRIKRDIDWGAAFQDALVRFEHRMRTPLIARTVTLITKASQMSGSIGEVLTIAASDAKMSEVLKRDRTSEMIIYTIIIYLSFFVFLFVVAVLTTSFLGVFSTIDVTKMPTTGALAGLGSAQVVVISRLMYHSVLIQAIGSGIIAGQMGEGSIGAGVKHAAILLAIALLAFNVFMPQIGAIL